MEHLHVEEGTACNCNARTGFLKELFKGSSPQVFYFLLSKWRRRSRRQELISLLTFPTAEDTAPTTNVQATRSRGVFAECGVCVPAPPPTCRRHCSRCRSPCFPTGWLSWSCSRPSRPAADAQVTAAERSSDRWLQTPYWLLEWLLTGPRCPDRREQPHKQGRGRYGPKTPTFHTRAAFINVQMKIKQTPLSANAGVRRGH